MEDVHGLGCIRETITNPHSVTNSLNAAEILEKLDPSAGSDSGGINLFVDFIGCLDVSL